jgi:hypothetical protein
MMDYAKVWREILIPLFSRTEIALPLNGSFHIDYGIRHEIGRVGSTLADFLTATLFGSNFVLFMDFVDLTYYGSWLY